MNTICQALKQNLDRRYACQNGVYRASDNEGYWSNIDWQDQAALLQLLEERPCRDVVQEQLPHLEEIIFNPLRAVGLRLLDIKDGETGIDYGCMWGNLLCYAARCCQAVVGVDQTFASLQLLRRRLHDEKLDNCLLVNTNLRRPFEFPDSFNFAIVNGVLEWIPDMRKIELKKLNGDGYSAAATVNKNPTERQLDFLRMVYRNLAPGGRLYLAIENRYYYQYFFGKRDPHTGLMGTIFLPRPLASLITQCHHGQPFVNYVHSWKELPELLRKAGFNRVSLFAVFPDYHFPQRIIPMDTKTPSKFVPTYANDANMSCLRKIMRVFQMKLDQLLFGKLKLFVFAPSFIAIARKRTSK